MKMWGRIRMPSKNKLTDWISKAFGNAPSYTRKSKKSKAAKKVLELNAARAAAGNFSGKKNKTRRNRRTNCSG